jgi:hypothetical protein
MVLRVRLAFKERSNREVVPESERFAFRIVEMGDWILTLAGPICLTA